MCTASIVKKVAAFAAAAELLRIAGEPAEKLMLFNGNTKDGLVAIGPLKDSASRARSSAAAPKGASVTSLPDYKRYVKTQYTIALNKNGGRCDKDARNAIGNGLWERVCVLAATEGASSVVKELHAKGKATFVEEAGDKARSWWNQSGNSEAAKMKEAWKESKRYASDAAPEEPGAKRQPPANPPAAAGAVGATAGGAFLNF